MNWRLLICAAVVGLAVSPLLWATQEEPPLVEEEKAWMPERPWEVIEVAILLDTSGSMESLIDAARLKLWEVVQELSLLEPTPTLRVAILTYGNSSNGNQSGWVRIETDLTEDLDLVSERLFELTSQGGEEYVGRALQAALSGLTWADSEDALRLIFVAGNESADQDEVVSFRDMADLARREGIPVHALYCGQEEHEDAEGWQELAELGAGEFVAVNHQTGTVTVETPYDEELAELSAALNRTYLPVGEEGRKRHQNVIAQDENAANLSRAAAASRAEVKTRRMFSSGWDLVEDTSATPEKLVEVLDEDLPEELQPLSPEERELYVEELRLERDELKQRIAELSAERRKFVAETKATQGLDDSRAFDTALRQAIRAEAEAKGFSPPD